MSEPPKKDKKHGKIERRRRGVGSSRVRRAYAEGRQKDFEEENDIFLLMIGSDTMNRYERNIYGDFINNHMGLGYRVLIIQKYKSSNKEKLYDKFNSMFYISIYLSL